jgi:tetraacyldisaccharide 4'-kinase
VILSDDGLQHYQLERAFEIVVVDGVRGFGNSRMLPSGPLREPAKRVASVDAIVVNGTGQERMPFTTRPPMYMMHLSGEQFVSLAEPERTATADAFAGKRVQAIAGIGNPGRFFETLRKLGLDPVCHVFPDHHAYAREDIAYRDADIIVMTDKDAIKCRAFADPRMWRLPVAASVGPRARRGHPGEGPWTLSCSKFSSVPSPRDRSSTTRRSRSWSRRRRGSRIRSATAFPVMLEEEARKLTPEEVARQGPST